MCGRYASARRRIELLEEFGVQAGEPGEELRPDYNVAPTKKIYAVMTRRPPGLAGADGGNGSGGDGTAEAAERAEALAPGRQLRTVRWGLVPSGPRTRHRQPDDQRQGRDRGQQARVPPGVRQAALPAPRGRLLQWYKPGRIRLPSSRLHPRATAPLAS
jgi:putative SOS response-associated peptidase YedK